MLFMNISRSWTNIALSTSALWTSIEIEYPEPPLVKSENLFDAWLKRAGTRTTSVFSLHGRVPKVVAVLVNQHAPSMRNLQLRLSSGRRIQPMMGSFESLQTLIIAQDIRDGMHTSQFASDASGCIELLRAAPNLMECNFEGVYFEVDNVDICAPTHTSLRHLRLGGPRGRNASSASILHHFTLPALQSLSVSHFNIPLSTAVSFLSRSSSPLKSLSMSTTPAGPEISISSFFRLVPGLTDLDITIWYSYVELHLLLSEVLSTDPDILPNLRNLTVRGDSWRSAQYGNLVSLLAACRTPSAHHVQLQSFQIVWNSPSLVNFVGRKIIEALRRLAADGMDIHMGDEHTNFLSQRWESLDSTYCRT
ncbi:hypothetical protein FB451DRAFT_1166040 [Mycena latifolia]|nr:hypothetical protein FB451DRAFT_1166040 [Mycena latifolia]